jgi:SOS-response transcriptional repressor LexA|tara:strand:+ start:2092 stop:2346 length:255 start_codon:yes stop_codon:yes gene_type:complete
MTEKQLKLLEAIEAYWEEFNCGPSLDALAYTLGISSKSTVHAMLKRLEDNGWVTMQPNKWRTVMSTRRSPFKKVEISVDEQVKM